MAFSVKDWQNAPSTATPLDAAAFVDLETRLSDYTDEETLRAEAAESANATNITAETSRAEAAEATLATAVSTETTRAEAAEATKATITALTSETTRAEAAESTNATAISAEVTRAEAAEALKAPLASPALTGAPTAPTQTALDNSTKLSTTAYADSAVAVEKSRAQAAESTNTTAISTETTRAEAAEALKAPLASPTLTGIPSVPTATPLTNSTQIASTAYTDSAVAVEVSRAQTAEALKAPLASPALTGTPTAPTQTAGDNSTKIATDAFVTGAVATETTRAQAAEALAVLKSNNGSDFVDAGSTRTNLHVPVLTPAACVVTTNVVTLSGLNTYDGYQTVAGDLILLTAQTTAAQNGLWTAAAGAWTRPTEMATGVTMKARTVAVINGTLGKGSTWMLSTNTTITVDTTAQTWLAQLPGSVVNASQAGGVPAWAPSTAYTVNTLVTNSGNTYICATAHTSGSTFSAEAGDWQAIGGVGALTAPNVVGATGTNLGSAQTLTLNADTPQWLVGTMNANLTVTITGIVAGGTARLILTQDATGGRTLTLASSGMTSVSVPISTAATSSTEIDVYSPDGVNLVANQQGSGASGSRGSLWYTGSGAPGTIAGQQNGDFYLDNSGTGYVYELITGAWSHTGTIAGPTGAMGTRGSLWYEGSGAPGTITGQQNGDQYLDIATGTAGNVYQLISGTWTLEGNIKGATATSGRFGDGSNGPATLDGTTTFSWASLASNVYTLSQDVCLTSLTINSGVTLKVNGFRIMVAGTFTNNGTIGQSGSAAVTSAAGAAGGTGTVGSGAAGAAGGTGNGAIGTFSTVGSGGAGGTGSSGTAGAGAGSVLPGAGYVHDVFVQPDAAGCGAYYWSGTVHACSGGCGGSAGGGDGTNKGGAGGAGGPMIVIYAYSFVNSGAIIATGGAGGTPTTGNCGGGGGGGGGLVLIYTLTTATTGTITLTGGAAGSGNGGDIGGNNNNEVVSVLGGQTPITQSVVPTVYVASYLPPAFNYTSDASSYINAAITACPPGGEVVFPAVTLNIANPVVGKSFITLRGAQGVQSQVPHLQAITGSSATLPAMIASSTWFNNTTTSDKSMVVRDLVINANNTAGIGIVFNTWRGRVYDCRIQGTTGDGVSWLSFTQNNTVVASGALVESGAWRTIVEGAGRYGFSSIEITGRTGAVTDGFLVDCIVNGANTSGAVVTTHGVYLSQSGGWKVDGNHVYGLLGYGFYLKGSGFTRVVNNYAETWGAGTGTNYGIYVLTSTNGIVVANNSVRIDNSVSGNTYVGININSQYGQSVATCTGNTVTFGTQSSGTTIGIWYYTGATGGENLFVADTGNNIINGIAPNAVGTLRMISAGVTMVQQGPLLTGTATLVAGTVAVANTSITSGSWVKASTVSAGGTPGSLSPVMTSGTGFAINSTSSTDTSEVLWEIMQY
ncbi:unnamed protein product [Sphagnum balticum]